MCVRVRVFVCIRMCGREQDTCDKMGRERRSVSQVIYMCVWGGVMPFAGGAKQVF